MNTSKLDNPGDAKPETPAQAEKPVTAPHFRARAKRVPGETTGSLCRIAAQHLGLLGAEVAPGRYQLRCPWAHQHAQHCKQRDGILDNSAILYMPGAELSDAERAAQGDNMPLDGGLFCTHEHSGGDHKGVPLNAEVFLSYARACGAPLPDRPRYMVDEKDEDEKGYESDRGSTGSFRVRRGLKLAEHSRAYQEFLKSESANGSADTREGVAPVKPLAVLHVAASAEIVVLNGLTLPLIQIRTNGDEMEITYQATHKDVPGGACYADVVACLQINPVPVKHHALNAVGITMLRVTKLDLPKQVSKGVAHATLTGINASTKIAATFAEYVGERPTTPFKKFLADCLTPEQADRLQLIFGRMRSSDPRLTDKCYVHIGDGANGKTTLLSAVVKLFKGVRLSGAVEGDAKVLLQLEPAVAVLECADAVSPVWIKTMATSGTQVHITSNRELSALDADQSILRRVEVIRWEKTIPADQRNPDMANEIAEDIDFAFWLFKGQERIHAGER